MALAAVGPVARQPDHGRLPAYFPDLDLACGAAEVESRGYFDVHNCPPWDTWVETRDLRPPHGERSIAVVAWVPPVFVPFVDRGIEVNPEQCIVWLSALS